MKILIVEDDRALNNGIALSLKGEEILQAFSLAQARSLLDGCIDLVILDINLPDGSGLDYCREIREKSGVAIIFLTANDMEIDIVTGLEMGADDYITKPFSLMVLRARVNAVFRRRQEQEYGQSKRAEKNEGQGRFFFDFERMLFKVDGRPVELSKTEQKLLRLLVANQGNADGAYLAGRGGICGRKCAVGNDEPAACQAAGNPGKDRVWDWV